ncbi:2-C-methyl-D-erythritol 4-phosphate cytidylyltransferase [Pseudodesulfovibrio sp. F-1]|uniref:Bifunctional enzyme IspD/IspF n=1 Tax=Pseudodesulfovibrio alkaliphilus TaxID=2661613 RepID=A0A7K1KMB3_9BACT|nr:2-C-methyl-D-erythritol 4-phosphate cytidylyltransferase [Pseudodesulfovibrio alkaliphilus]MUM77228.1 2-C-methyl-D-erythritol 4-phosphate cytidylyltransferase [Pseudodesulfovibrio alkaliphilus]
MNRPLENIWGIILAAGSGSRLAGAAGGVAKQYIEHRGAPLFWLSARTFSRVAGVRGVVFVFPDADMAAMDKRVNQLFRSENLGLDWAVCAGGARRQDSVALGLAALPSGCDGVLVHDAARPFVSASTIALLIDALRRGERAAIPAIAVADTVKRVVPDRSGGESVAQTLDRAALRAVQTPQAFETKLLREAHAQAGAQGWEATDDASMAERMTPPVTVAVIPGDPGNVKITTPEDLKRLEEARTTVPCVGWGYDVHRFGAADDRPLVLGGVPVPGGPTVVAHSDGDVLLHALADAVLGTFGGGDIGTHFPDTDARFAGADSGVLLRETLAMAEAAGVRPVQADLTIITQIPKIAPHAGAIAVNAARLLGLPADRVNVKATTEEGLGFTGSKQGIKAVAVVTALREV